MSNPERKGKIPDAPVPAALPGNLLSSVAPPTELPNFITATTAPVDMAQPAAEPVPVTPIIVQQREEPQNMENFSPAIPLSKGEPMLPIRSPEDSQTTQSPDSLPASTPEMERIGDVMPGSALFTWVKGAVSTGGILHRVAEKAKSSVDSMITTLDPQMKEYLKSGGDIYAVVASDKEVKISPIREAFQAVFGKATIVGFSAQSDVTAEQPVGYAAAYAAAKQRIAHLRSLHSELNNNVPIIAVESFLNESISDRWFDIALLVLSQPSLGIELQLQSQGTPVPSPAVAALQAHTPADYAHAQTGYSATVGSIMAASLQVPHTQWQEATTGVSRREILLLAARSLAGSYKKMLAVSAAEA
ncbi:protein PRRC1-like isoform X2 [Pectinophora gossypiella]|uniref:protein PRRC1-like isoform X2 n=1 Tax=Pectinophora gossypiella TaxID=13191 RepID=UPI00214EE79F|nr:protein PRRC1-like isoform X2 [Pectinophora gossypiella]